MDNKFAISPVLYTQQYTFNVISYMQSMQTNLVQLSMYLFIRTREFMFAEKSFCLAHQFPNVTIKFNPSMMELSASFSSESYFRSKPMFLLGMNQTKNILLIDILSTDFNMNIFEIENDIRPQTFTNCLSNNTSSCILPF